jgi:hypothetical protein
MSKFLELNNIDDTDHFFKFFDKFIQSNYLNSYRQSHNLVYALNRICMRIWKDPLTENQMHDLSKTLCEYHEALQGNYIEIFDEISVAINP